jgi:hypothetical protein
LSVGSFLRINSGLPLYATTGLAAFLFLGALVVMAAIAGWNRVIDQFDTGISFWFAVAFAAELVAFFAYVFAYRSVAAVEGGRRLGLGEATELVAVGFGAFLAEAQRSTARLSGDGARANGKVKCACSLSTRSNMRLSRLRPCAAAIALPAQGRHKPGLDFTIPWATLVPIAAVLAFIGASP